ncbi:MAG: CsgG/HfaB family protein [candidate division NC10 bacterium]|nr:CsgG/HfaB family protein [candidate division NC10 bacterium]
MKRLCALLSLVLWLLPGIALAQKIGILPFEDASGVGPGLGEQVAKFIRSEFLRDKKYVPKFIAYKTQGEGESETVDLEKAIELGRSNGVDYVLIGTILEAEASSSSSGLGGISVLGKSAGSSLRTVKAKITIQGDLISAKEGKVIESFRATGSKTDRSVGADVSTEWGSLDTDSSKENAAPNAKALREAVEKLVKQIEKKI